MPIGGFAQKQRIEHAAWTFGQVLKAEISIAGLLDRDYRCEEEIHDILAGIRATVSNFHILGAKEIENYMLVPHAIGKAIEARLRGRRDQFDLYKSLGENPATKILNDVTEAMRGDVQSQIIGNRIRYLDRSHKDITTIAKEAVDYFDEQWHDSSTRLRLVSGKATISALNSRLLSDFGVSITGTQITSHMRLSDLPEEMQLILKDLDDFARVTEAA